MSKYYSIHEFSKIIGVSAQTLRNWDANGKLHPHHTTVSGYRYYSDEQLNQVINVKPKNRITIGYCRVSSHKQKDDLERQIDNVKTYLLAKGQPFEIISDIGSGINYKKKGLQGYHCIGQARAFAVRIPGTFYLIGRRCTAPEKSFGKALTTLFHIKAPF